jgi:hypothetical protein
MRYGLNDLVLDRAKCQGLPNVVINLFTKKAKQFLMNRAATNLSSWTEFFGFTVFISKST